MAQPSIACIGIISQSDSPLHITLFPPHQSAHLQFHLLLNSSLDIFDIRLKQKLLDQDLGLLHAVDERFATYGYLTNTGIKFIIAIDMEGRPASQTVAGGVQPQPVLGLRDSDLKPAWRTIHAAYTELLLNPFYTPETRTPVQTMQATGKPALITSKRFGAAMERVGSGWYPGVTSL